MYPIATMCRLLSVSTSGYYAWINRSPSARSLRNHELTARIRKIHEGSRETYGRLRIHAELMTEGIRIGGKRVARLMREAGIQGVTRRKAYRTTIRGRVPHMIPDLVDRKFVADGPNRLWVADITYIHTWAGFLFLAVVLDAFSRKIIGFQLTS